MASALAHGSDAGQDHWWQHAVIYQIYPRSFKDSDGDGVGDLKGVISKMDYLAELGITAIWLSPIYQSPMVDFGYDISNFTAIHDEYGTMEDFEHLIAVSRRLDIKVILDFVPNHTSDQCEWFQRSLQRDPPYDDFYVWHDGVVDEKGQRKPPNNWRSVFSGSAWTWNPRRRQFYLHQFAGGQPDLNFRNSRVVAAMDDILRFWLDKGVDGFRVDAVNHLFEVADLRDEPLSGKTNDSRSYEYTDHIYTKDLTEVYDMVQHWRKLLDEYRAQHGGGERIMMTEAYADIKSLMDYYEDAKGTVGAHFPFNFLLITDLDQHSDARDFVHCLQTWLTYMPRGHTPNWVLGNHDRARVASRFGPDLVDAMNIMLLTLPGIAVTYNGEEIGMRDHRDISWMDTVDPWARNSNPKEYRTLSRDPVRTPFQWDNTSNAGFSWAAKTWLPVHPNYKEVNLAEQKTAAASHYKVYKRLIDLRRTLPALRSGRFEAVALNRNVFAYKRELKGHPAAVVIINVGPVEEQLNLTRLDGFVPAQLQVLVTSSGSSYSASESIPAAALRMAPRGALLAVAHE